MKALDTNILIRLITRDDAKQATVAAREAESGEILLLHTVLIEVEWVLRASYKWPRRQIHDALAALIRVENVIADDPAMLDWALSRYAAGADFADMIHLSMAHDAKEFVTFDQRLGQAMGDLPVPVRTV